MSDVRTLLWNLLSFNGNLPDEIIVKILYDFNGLSHPLVSILLNETKINKYERLQTLPIAKQIQKHYYKYGCNNNLIEIMNNKQKFFNINSITTYLNYNDPGYFIPRINGRLFYSIFDENNTIEITPKINWSLNRSKHLLEKIKCVGCLKHYASCYEYNSSKEKLKKYTYVLKELENKTWVCNYCFNIGLDKLSIV
jgi:hypothetical protein